MAADGSFTYTPDTGFFGHEHLHLHGVRRHVGVRADHRDHHGGGEAPTRHRWRWTTPTSAVAGPAADARRAGRARQRHRRRRRHPHRHRGSRSPINGTVHAGGNGSFTYTPDAGFTGKDIVHLPRRATARPPPAGHGEHHRDTGGGSGDSPAASAVAGASAPFTYGTAGSVAVGVSPAAATGKVELVDGGQVIASGALASGQARLALPAKGAAARHAPAHPALPRRQRPQGVVVAGAGGRGEGRAADDRQGAELGRRRARRRPSRSP